jgi:hypothetical protein
LQEELGDESDRLIAGFGTRFELQLAMMKHPLRSLPYRELEWIMAEGGGLQEYFADIDPQAVRRCVEATRKEILKQLESGLQNDGELRELLRPIVGSSTLDRVQNWSEAKWRKVSLEFLCGLQSRRPAHACFAINAFTFNAFAGHRFARSGNNRSRAFEAVRLRGQSTGKRSSDSFQFLLFGPGIRSLAYA